MHRFRLVVPLLGLVGVGGAAGCQSDSPVDDAGVSEDLLVTSSGFANDVTVFPDRLELPRAGHDDVLSMRIGKILTGAPSARDGNPHGFLRRATGVHDLGDRIVVDTEPAALTDVFHGRASFGVDGANGDDPTLGSASIRPDSWTRLLGGNMIFPTVVVMRVAANFVDPVRSNESFDVTAKLTSGSVSFRPQVSTGISISGGELESAHLTASGHLDARVGVNVDVKATGSTDTTRRGLLQPMHIDFRVAEFSPARALQFVAGVPVWETVEIALVLRCELTLNGEANMTARVATVVDGTFGAQYAKGAGWSAVRQGPTLDASGSGIDVNQSGTGDIKCSLEPQVALLVYDFAGPTLAIGPYAAVHVDEVARTWSVQPGVRADVGVLLAFLGRQIATERVSIVDEPIGAPFTGSY
jgi:hypothetical protein